MAKERKNANNKTKEIKYKVLVFQIFLAYTATEGTK